VIKTSINESELQVPITLYEGKILSGRARYRACQELGVKLTKKDFEDKNFESEDKAKQFVWNSNNARRHAKSQARLMDLLQNEDFVTRNEKDKKGYDRRKYIPTLLAGECTSNEVGVATRIRDCGHQDLIELYRSAEYPSTTCDLLAKQTDEYLDNLFKADPQTFKEKIEALKKSEKEEKHKAKISRVLPTWSSKISTTWQLPMGQSPLSVELTPELVNKTLLLWAKEGVLKGVAVPNEVDETTNDQASFEDYLEDMGMLSVGDESGSLSDPISVLSAVSEPNPEGTVETKEDLDQTTDQSSQTPEATKTSPVEKVKKTASKSKSAKKSSTKTSRNRVKLTDIDASNPSPVQKKKKKRSNLRLS